MSPLDSSSIYNFYNNEKMKDFSKTAFRQLFCELDSVYGFFLLPVDILGSIDCFVAITTETVQSKNGHFGQVFITNYCLKYHPEDFNKLREMDGIFKVLDFQVTENEAIAFQISKNIQ